MPKDRKPTPAQLERAARLRSRIAETAAGTEPPAPETPREITDEAARKKWDESRKQK